MVEKPAEQYFGSHQSSMAAPALWYLARPRQVGHLAANLAGAGGLEPPNGGIKIRCLTTWRRPNTGPGGNRLQARRTITASPRYGKRFDGLQPKPHRSLDRPLTQQTAVTIGLKLSRSQVELRLRTHLNKSDRELSATMTTTVSMTKSGLWRGVRLSLPFCASSIIYGIAFGLLATGVGLSKLEAVLMSVLVFSGSAQVVVLQAWASHPALLPVFVTVLVANLRYLLMGAALRSWLAPFGTLRTTVLLLPLVDGSFAVSARERARGDHDAGILLGSSLVSYAGWIVGTAVGTTAGNLIANPRAIGLDFIIVAFCAASAAALLRRRADIWPAASAVAAVLACERWLPGPWTVIAAALAAAAVGALRYAPPAINGAASAKP